MENKNYRVKLAAAVGPGAETTARQRGRHPRAALLRDTRLLHNVYMYRLQKLIKEISRFLE